jgi:hypothetical protein
MCDADVAIAGGGVAGYVPSSGWNQSSMAKSLNALIPKGNNRIKINHIRSCFAIAIASMRL